jgi:hypothetical protein
LMQYSSSFFITQDSLVIQFVNIFFIINSGISEKNYRIAKIRSSLVVNDVSQSFSFR